MGYPDLTLASWALRTADIERLVGRLRAVNLEAAAPAAGSRETPSGSVLRWKTAFATGPRLELAPFFIEWSGETPHPSASAPGGCRLVALVLEHPEPASLRALLAAADFELDLRSGEKPHMRLTLDCIKGRVTFVSS